MFATTSSKSDTKESNRGEGDSFESSLSSSLSEVNIDIVMANSHGLLLTPEKIDLRNWTWNYRGEGGANLVISLQNDAGVRKIARFSKSKYKDKDHDAKIDETAFYTNSVMAPLLGSKFVRPVTIGVMDDFDYETVKMEAQPFRPLARCKKDIQSRKVILSPDCVFLDELHLPNTYGDTLSIEVKPKQGWHPGYAPLCSRCLKQEAKLQSGEIQSISKYCPLDLFSGNLQRVKKAIFDLYENPHNRFKIFKNGQLIYTEKTGDPTEIDADLSSFFNDEESGINYLASVLGSVLLGLPVLTPEMLHLSPKRNNPESKACEESEKKGSSMSKESILGVLLGLQKLSNEVNDIKAEALSDKLLNEVESSEELHNLTVWYPLVSNNSNSKMMSSILEDQLGFSQTFIQDLRNLQQFLLSVTAKDVSLLITLRSVEDPNVEESLGLPNLKLGPGKFLRVMISVIDLDPKPVHRIPTWIQRRQEWLNCYLKKNH